MVEALHSLTEKISNDGTAFGPTAPRGQVLHEMLSSAETGK